jgi:hypothetical protein
MTGSGGDMIGRGGDTFGRDGNIAGQGWGHQREKWMVDMVADKNRTMAGVVKGATRTGE